MSDFRSMDQLRSMSWPTYDAAVKEMKRNGFKERGADYRIGEFSPTAWQVLPLEDDVSQIAPAKQGPKPGRETLSKTTCSNCGAKLTAGNVKAGTKLCNTCAGRTIVAVKKKTAHPGDVRDRELIRQAASYAVHFRINPKKRLDQTAKSLAEAMEIAERWNVEHGKSGRRAMIYAVPKEKGASIPIPSDMLTELLAEQRPAPESKNVEPTVAVQKVAARTAKGDASPQPGAKPPEAAQPANDLTPPSAVDGPYGLCIVDAIAQHSIATVALEWSRKIGCRVGLTNKAGKVVRVIDGRLGGKRPTRTAVRREGATPRAPGTGKMAQATALLLRKEGATAKEINAVTDWPVGQRHINKLAKLAGATIKTMGDKHWRLIKA